MLSCVSSAKRDSRHLLNTIPCRHSNMASASSCSAEVCRSLSPRMMDESDSETDVADVTSSEVWQDSTITFPHIAHGITVCCDQGSQAPPTDDSAFRDPPEDLRSPGTHCRRNKKPRTEGACLWISDYSNRHCAPRRRCVLGRHDS